MPIRPSFQAESFPLKNENKTARLTIVNYPSGYILKPQSDDFDFLPEAEYMSMKMAEAARIQTVPNALIRIRGKYAYITRRIDRKGDSLIAMEDFYKAAFTDILDQAYISVEMKKEMKRLIDERANTLIGLIGS